MLGGLVLKSDEWEELMRYISPNDRENISRLIEIVENSGLSDDFFDSQVFNCLYGKFEQVLSKMSKGLILPNGYESSPLDFNGCYTPKKFEHISSVVENIQRNLILRLNGKLEIDPKTGIYPEEYLKAIQKEDGEKILLYRKLHNAITLSQKNEETTNEPLYMRLRNLTEEDIRKIAKEKWITEDYFGVIKEETMYQLNVPGSEDKLIQYLLLGNIMDDDTDQLKDKVSKIENLSKVDYHIEREADPSPEIVQKIRDIFLDYANLLENQKHLADELVSFCYEDDKAVHLKREAKARILTDFLRELSDTDLQNEETVRDKMALLILSEKRHKISCESLISAEKYQFLQNHDKQNEKPKPEDGNGLTKAQIEGIQQEKKDYDMERQEYQKMVEKFQSGENKSIAAKKAIHEKKDKIQNRGKELQERTNNIRRILKDKTWPKDPINALIKGLPGEQKYSYSYFADKMTLKEKLIASQYMVAALEREKRRVECEIELRLLERSFGKDKLTAENGEHVHVYRAGNYDAVKGIEAHNLSSDLAPNDHIAHGSSSASYNTPFISTTTSPIIAGTYIYDYRHPEKSGRAKCVEIDVSVLYEGIQNELKMLSDDNIPVKGEYEFWQMCQNLPDIPAELHEYIQEKMDGKVLPNGERKEELSEEKTLPEMIFDASDERCIEDEMDVLRLMNEAMVQSTLTGGNLTQTYAQLNPKSTANDREKKAKAFGMASLEVLFKGRIPAVIEGQSVIKEVDPISLDILQAVSMGSNEEHDYSKLPTVEEIEGLI